MTVSAHDVATALRERLPGLPTKKLHKLLYYCQGHHLAVAGEPMFSETISAWDMGPVVGTLWYAERQRQSRESSALDEAQLNTVGYVVSRYGGLTGQDLEHLTHSESPWQRANARRRPKTSARIDLSWLEEHFRAAAVPDDDDVHLDSDEVAAWLRGAEDRKRDEPSPDSPEAIIARLR